MNYLAIYKRGGSFLCKVELGFCADVYEASKKAAQSPEGSLSALADAVTVIPQDEYNA